MPVRVIRNLSARSVMDAFRARELLEDATPGGVRERGEGGVEVVGCILNHMVQYGSGLRKMQVRYSNALKII
jgi:hypothetical protein